MRHIPGVTAGGISRKDNHGFLQPGDMARRIRFFAFIVASRYDVSCAACPYRLIGLRFEVMNTWRETFDPHFLGIVRFNRDGGRRIVKVLVTEFRIRLQPLDGVE